MTFSSYVNPTSPEEIQCSLDSTQVHNIMFDEIGCSCGPFVSATVSLTVQLPVYKPVVARRSLTHSGWVGLDCSPDGSPRVCWAIICSVNRASVMSRCRNFPVTSAFVKVASLRTNVEMFTHILQHCQLDIKAKVSTNTIMPAPSLQPACKCSFSEESVDES